MRNNKVIRISLVFTRVVFIFLIAISVLFTFIVIHSRFSPESYNRVELKSGYDPGYHAGSLRIYTRDNSGKEKLLLSNLSDGMAFWYLIRSVVFFILTAMIVMRISKILKSIENLNTFYKGNIRHFRYMAKIGITIFVLSCFNFRYLEDDWQFYFTIAFGPLAFALGCLVMAEIFKEGKQLIEDKNLIV